MCNDRAIRVLRRPSVLLGVAVGLALTAGSTCRAGFTQFFQLHEVDYTQSGNAAPAAESSAKYLTRPTSTTTPDFTGVTMTGPVGSPLVLSVGSPGFWDSGLSSHVFATQAQLVAAFPTGTYSLAGTGGSAPTTASIVETQSTYPAAHPFLTGTTFSSLQGLNPTQPITVTWDSFVAGPGATSSTLFLTIFGPSGDVFNQLLPTTTTSQLLAANTFQASTAYTLQLGWYSDVGSNVNGVNLEDRFGNTTTASFTTSAPEPGTMGVVALVMGAVAWRRRGRR